MHIVHFDENMLIWDAADLDAFMEMYGVDTGKVYKLGQKVKVRVVGCDKQNRTIDFELAEWEEEHGKLIGEANSE